MTNLQIAHFSQNEIVDISDELYELKQLGYLNLRDNKLKTLSEKIGNLKKLNKLFLSGNNLQSIPASISQLSNLDLLEIDKACKTALPQEKIDIIQYT